MIESLEKLKESISKYLVGYEKVIEALFASLIVNGHILLEGPPGVAKTTLAKIFAKLLNMSFKRIQFTPDLLPSDIIGTVIFNPSKGTFEVKLGPIFANIILADEINRAPPKTQSALLEAMEERQVTIEGKTFKLPEPFMVIATQNPVEQEGTYPLPEAQLDRFLMKISITYPAINEEFEILKRKEKENEKIDIEPLLTKEDIDNIKSELQKIYVSEKIMDYIARIVSYIRNSPYVEWGPGPRASISLLKVAKVCALLEGRDYVVPSDVEKFAVWILQHRFSIKPEYEIEGITNETIIKEALNRIDTL